MTERLYYTDSYTTSFTAQIVERLTVDKRPAVVLDRSYFYPTGGGQPHDIGTIGGANVVEVFTQEGDNKHAPKKMLHVLDADVVEDEVACKIDWARRFDLMQHHTGQHILTQAFVQVAGANTVGFHLSDATVTIDLDTVGLTEETLAEVEELANRIVWENRPVTVEFIDPKKARGVRMRGTPEKLLTDGLRVVSVENFESTGCGGTHVARTGEIGLIKILKLEKRKNNTRVEFQCGQRALQDYRQKNSVVNGLRAILTCGVEEIEPAVSRMRDDLKTNQRGFTAAKKQLLAFEMAAMVDNAAEHDGFRLIKAVFDDRDAKQLRILANSLVSNPKMIVLLGIVEDGKGFVLLARHDTLPHDMNALLQRVLPILNNARGGGRPNHAQGGGVKADMQAVEFTLNEAERVLLNEKI